MTRKQAEYQANRASIAAYNRRMRDPQSPGRAWMREDSAQANAKLAYNAKMKEWGY